MLLLCSCIFPEDSKDKETNSIHANFFLISEDGARVEVNAIIREREFAPPLLLEEGDFFESTHGNQTQVLNSKGSIGLGVNPDSAQYSATFEYQSDEIFIINYYRVHKEDAINSYVTLPQKFDLLSPTDGSVFNENEEIELKWWPPTVDSEYLVYSYTYNCEKLDGTESFGATSDFSLENGIGESEIIISQFPSMDHDAKTCDVKLSIEAINYGELDSTFKSGAISASQKRTVSLRYVR